MVCFFGIFFSILSAIFILLIARAKLLSILKIWKVFIYLYFLQYFWYVWYFNYIRISKSIFCIYIYLSISVAFNSLLSYFIAEMNYNKFGN